MAKIKLLAFLGGLTLATVLSGPCFAADEAGEYHVAQVWKIGGAGGWDYVTGDARNKLL